MLVETVEGGTSLYCAGWSQKIQRECAIFRVQRMGGDTDDSWLACSTWSVVVVPFVSQLARGSMLLIPNSMLTNGN